MTADDREALAAWQRQVTAIDRLDRKIEALGRVGASSFKAMDSSFASVAARFFTLDKGLDLLISGIRQFGEAQRELDQRKAEAAISRDDAFMRFRGQAGMNEEQAAPFRERLEQIEAELKTLDLKWLSMSARQFLSSGFDKPKEAIEAAKATGEMVIATGSVGQADATQTAADITKFMSATEQPMTAEQVKLNTRLVAQMKDLGNLEPESLQFLAQEAGSLTQAKIPWEEQMRMFTTLLFSVGDRVAATSGRVMIQRLQGAKGDPGREDALQALKIKPSEVNFARDIEAGEAKAEEWIDVVLRLGKALNELPEGDRAPTLEKLFGAEGQRAAFQLLKPENIERIRKWQALQPSEEEFQRKVKIQQEGPAAEASAAKIRQEAQLDQPGAARRATFREEFRTQLIAKEARGDASAYHESFTIQLFDFLRGFKIPDHIAAVVSEQIVPNPFGNARQFVEAPSAVQAASIVAPDSLRPSNRPEQSLREVREELLRNRVIRGEQLPPALIQTDERRKITSQALEARDELQRRERLRADLQSLPEQQRQFMRPQIDPNLPLPPGIAAPGAAPPQQPPAKVEVRVDNKEVAAAIERMVNLQEQTVAALGQVAQLLGRQPGQQIATRPTPGRQPLRGLG